MPGSRRPGASSQRGLSLIEVLIALLVLTIGLVGMAALHLNSLKNVHSSHYRSMASAIGLDFEERLWLASADESLDDCPNINDIADQTMEFWNQTDPSDNWAWSDAQRLNVPGITAEVGTIQDADTWAQVPITFTWTDERFEDGESFSYVARIICREEST